MRPMNAVGRLRGITLIEMVVVLALLAMLGTYAVSNFGPTLTSGKLKAAAKGLQSMGMFARNEALARNRTIRVWSDGGATVEVQDATDPDNIRVLRTMSLEAPVSLPELNVAFDSAGRLSPLGTEKEVSVVADVTTLDPAVSVPVVRFLASGLVQSCVGKVCE